MKGNQILLISPEPWGTNYVSKHHYAVELARRGNKVYFLNPPSDKTTIERVSKNLSLISYRPLFRGVRFLPIFVQWFLTKIEYLRIEKMVGSQFNVIWNFDSSRFFALKKIKNVIKICHIVDLTEVFHRERLAKESDFCFCTSSFILNDLLKFNEKSFKIPHGYAQNNQVANSPLMISIDKIKVGYIGNLSIKYIRWDIIKKIVEENPLCEFYFIGPRGKSNLTDQVVENMHFEYVKSCENVTFIDAIKPTEISKTLTQFDVLIVCYDTDNFKEQLANPHKILEYLSSGKVIVSTFTSEYSKLGLLEMVEDISEYSNLFASVVSNLDFYNSSEKKNARIDYAKNNTYSHQIDLIQKILTS